MLRFEDALTAVVSAAPALELEEVALSEGVGRVLAQAVTADLDLPPFDTTAMDGWAVRAADVPGAPTILRRAGTLAAGSVAGSPLGVGQALKVMTGAPMPEGSDAVVPVEASEPLDDGLVRLDEVPAPAAHVRRRGEVLASGAVVLRAGRKLSPSDLVLAAAAGHDRLRVARRARAAVLVTGDEIVEPGQTPGPGQIRNTNGPLLLAALARLGARAVALGVVRDDRDELRASLEAALARRDDLLLTTGGVSAGDWDLVGDVLRKLGADVLFHKVRLRPAKPILVARAGPTLVFGLPGNPVSAAVGFDFFVRPAWRAASGLTPALPEPLEALLDEPTRNKGPRLALLPARLDGRKGGALRVSPLPSRGSHDVAAHAASNAYVRLEPESSYREGDAVSVFPATEETTLS